MSSEQQRQFNIFISYRREDAAGHVGRLYDSLTDHFSPEQIFMDVDHIEPGEDFVHVLEEAVGSCSVLLAVIGRHWLARHESGPPRLNNPNDFVRIEIASALKRNIKVIPILVHGAVMPAEEHLPDVLQMLSRRQAVEISDSRWKSDVERLVKFLNKILARQEELRNLQDEKEQIKRRAQEEEERLAAKTKRLEEERLVGEENKRRKDGKERDTQPLYIEQRALTQTYETLDSPLPVEQHKLIQTELSLPTEKSAPSGTAATQDHSSSTHEQQSKTENLFSEVMVGRQGSKSGAGQSLTNSTARKVPGMKPLALVIIGLICASLIFGIYIFNKYGKQNSNSNSNQSTSTLTNVNALSGSVPSSVTPQTSIFSKFHASSGSVPSSVTPGFQWTLRFTLNHGDIAKSSVYSVAFSPDGRTVASGSTDGTVKLWDAATGVLKQTLSHGISIKDSVHFSPDGKLLASAGHNVDIWDVQTGQLKQTLKFGGYVESATFSNDGRTLVSGGEKFVKLWDVQTGQLKQTFTHEDIVDAVALAPGGNMVAALEHSGKKVQLWDTQTGRVNQTLTLDHAVHSIAYSADGKTLATGLIMWEVQPGQLKQRSQQRSVEGLTKSIEKVTYSPDWQIRAILSTSGSIDLENLQSHQLQTLQHGRWVHAVAFSPDGKMLASGDDNGTIKLWRLTP